MIKKTTSLAMYIAHVSVQAVKQRLLPEKPGFNSRVIHKDLQWTKWHFCLPHQFSFHQCCIFLHHQELIQKAFLTWQYQGALSHPTATAMCPHMYTQTCAYIVQSVHNYHKQYNVCCSVYPFVNMSYSSL
jgi:hypothetical protein